jgi:hypothetical protein
MLFFTCMLLFSRITLALVFALSCIGKVRNIAAFQDAIEDFQLLPPAWSKALSRIFPTMEFACVLLIVIGGYEIIIGFLLAALLLMIFSGALVMVLQRKKNVQCNCFGLTEQHVSPYDVVRNLLFIVCSLLGIWAFYAPQQSFPWSAIVLIGCLSACFVILATNLSDIIETLKKPFHAFGV